MKIKSLLLSLALVLGLALPVYGQGAGSSLLTSVSGSDLVPVTPSTGGTLDTVATLDTIADYIDTNMDSLTITATSASTSGSTSVEPVVMNSTMTGVGGVGGRARFELDTNVALGGWANALKGQIEFGAAGRVTGLGSAVVAEMILSDGTTSGSYAPLEIELGMPTATSSTGTRTSFISLNSYGNATGLGVLDDNGFLFDLNGVTAGAAHIFALNAKTGIGMAATARVQVLGVTYYVPLCTDINCGGS